MVMLMLPTSIPGQRIRPSNTPPGKKMPSKPRRKSKTVAKKSVKRKPNSKQVKRVSKLS